MPLNIGLNSQSIIILANSFNPTVFNLYWLISEKLIKKEMISQSSFFTPALTNIITEKFNLFVSPDQLQFNGNGSFEEFEENVKTVLIPILLKLQAIPYHALGINFIWKAEIFNESIEEISKRLFVNERNEQFTFFQDGKPLFGSYMSKDYEKFRLNLDIRPVIAKNEQFFQYAFNFHTQFDETRRFNELMERLKKLKDCFIESTKICN